MVKPVKKLLVILASLASIVVVWAVHGFWVHVRYHGTVEEITFQTGDVVLKGWFVKPDGPGPHPAVVLLHGAGRQPGSGMPARIYGNAFLRSGVAVLSYDKRGVGGSGGTFVRTRYTDFIEDAISAVRYLKTRTDVDAGGIGLVGNSESGWFTPEIAERTGDVAFVINRAGPTTPWIETNLWEVRHELQDAGVEDKPIEEFLRIQETVWRFVLDVDADASLADGEQWKRIDEEIAAFDRTYVNFIPKLPDYDRRTYGNLAAYIGYDPRPYIERIQVPVLYVYAENDKNVPSAECVRHLQELQTRDRGEIEIRVIPGVEHAMLSAAGLLSGSMTDPAYLDVVGPWAVSQVDAAEAR